MQTLRASQRSLKKKLPFQRESKHQFNLNQQKAFQIQKQTIKTSTDRKNPQDQDNYLRHIVKEYMKGRNIEQLKTKFNTEKLVKKRNRDSVECRTSQDFRKSKTFSSENRWKIIINSETKHKQILQHLQEQCREMKSCTCGAHNVQMNQIRFKTRDPVSKYQSNYTIDTKEAKSKSKSLALRPEITASYFSSKLEHLPHYSPKLGAIDFQSSYKTQFHTLNLKQQSQSFKYLKLSNVNFGPSQIKAYDTSYKREFDNRSQYKNFAKSPQPFVVKQSENLNAFGMKYHSIHSNYQKDFDEKRNGKRDSLKPPSLLKDLNLYLVKDSNYQQAFSPRTLEAKNYKREGTNKQKSSVVHQLSSSLAPLDGVVIDSEMFDTSYMKDFIKEKNATGKYSCPLGVKSSHGAVSKY